MVRAVILVLALGHHKGTLITTHHYWQLTDRPAQGLLVREGLTYKALAARGHGTSILRYPVDGISLEHVHVTPS